jgi:aryl-alcohol dehydrogenase
MQITAAVVRERSAPFALEKLELCDPRPDEVIVRVVASGMCQTDLHGRDGYFDSPYPAVYGHEGAGVVYAVGRAVGSLAPGDHVVMSFPWCGTCANCQQHKYCYCMHGRRLKMHGRRADGSTLMSRNGAPVFSAFFQQSSFGTYALTQERYAVKVRKDAPLGALGPLACSGQTGAGAVLNAMRPNPGESLAIFGVGAVGLSALMAAKIAGPSSLLMCTRIGWRWRANSAPPIRSITPVATKSSMKFERYRRAACVLRSILRLYPMCFERQSKR